MQAQIMLRRGECTGADGRVAARSDAFMLEAEAPFERGFDIPAGARWIVARVRMKNTDWDEKAQPYAAYGGRLRCLCQSDLSGRMLKAEKSLDKERDVGYNNQSKAEVTASHPAAQPAVVA